MNLQQKDRLVYFYPHHVKIVTLHTKDGPMKTLKALSLALLSLTTTAIFAGGPDEFKPDTGFYLGLGGGAGWSSAKTTNFVEVTSGVSSSGTSTLKDGSGFAARVFGGYQWKYVSLESAFTYVPDYTENDVGTATDGTLNINFNSKDKARLMYASLLGKASYPFSWGRVFAGLGMAVVFKAAQTRHTSSVVDGTLIRSEQSGAHATFLRPEIAVGINRHISKHALIQLDYNRIFAKGNIGVKAAEKNFSPNINTVLLNIIYMFY
jgi:hypothetical protein